MSGEWFPDAIVRLGPPQKNSGTFAPKLGAMLHSSEGSLASAMTVLDRVEGRGRASWCGTVPKTGFPIQHYPASAITWHSGDRQKNRELVGWEFEGVAGEPLTQSQVAWAAKIAVWLKERYEWDGLRRTQPGRTLWEHNEVVPTDCPSNRINWPVIMVRAVQLGGDDMGAAEDLELIKAHLARGSIAARLHSLGNRWQADEAWTENDETWLLALIEINKNRR